MIFPPKNTYECSHCHKHFKDPDVGIKIRNHCGVELKTRCCPFCGTEGFTRLDHERFFDKFNNDIGGK